MTITFAGIPLLLEDPEGRAGKFVERYMEWPRSTVNAPARVIDPKSRVQRPRWPLMPNLRPNQLYIPTGATRWGQFIGLTDKATKDAILASLVRGNGALRMSLDDGVTVPVSPTGNTIDGARFDLQNRIDTEMLLLPPVPVNDQSDGLWILPMVDARYQWQTRSFISTATTWAGLLGEISTSLGLTTTFKRDDSADVNAEYGIPDACIFRNGLINTAAALDLYCWATNQRLCPVNRQWNPGTAYVVNDVVVNGGLFYTCTVAGNSAATGPGPVGLSPGADGTVTWVGSICASPTYVLRSNTTSSDLYTKQVAAQNSTYNSGQFSAGSPFDKSKSEDVPTTIKFHFTNDGATDLLVATRTGAPSWATGGTLDVMCPATVTDTNTSDLGAMTTRWSQYFWQWSEWRFNWSFNRMLAWSLTGYEDYVLLDQSRTKRGNYNCRTFIKSLPPLGWGMDFVPLQMSDGGNTCAGSGGGGGGGGGGSGCGECCSCTNCVDPCDALDADIVLDCTSCPSGATKILHAVLGYWTAFPNLGDDPAYGYTKFTYVDDGGCTWRSANFTQSGGVYYWEFTPGVSVVLVHVSGSDTARITNGFNQVKWTFRGTTWSCYCHMPMELNAPDRVYKPDGLNCSICMKPVLTETIQGCPTIDGLLGSPIPCIPSLAFPALTWPTSPTYPYCKLDGVSSAVTVPLEKSLDHSGEFGGTCEWTGAVTLVETNYSEDDANCTGGTYPNCLCWPEFAATVLISYNTGQMRISVSSSGYSALYSHAGPYVIGSNTWTLVSSTGPTWPATIDVTMTECQFRSSHPDYGYGCGGSGVGCTGICPANSRALIEPETSPTGFVWTFDGAEPSTCSAGCGCNTIAAITALFGYPAGLGETAAAPCVNS